jgi:sulfur carrier protein ThiS
MTARLILHDREYPAQPGTTILYALIKAGIDIRVVRPTRDGEIIDLHTIIREGDVIKLVPLVAGG